MPLHIRRLALVLPCLLVLAGPAARADDWDDARDDFRVRMKSDAWTDRRDAFVVLAAYDGSEAVAEILDALEDEENGAVVLAGLETLGLFVSTEARAALLDAARDEKGRTRLLVLRSLQKQEGPEIEAALVEAARDGRDAPAAAQAALVFARRETLPADARPVLLDLLEHKDWQVRAGAARALANHPDPEALGPLAAALQKAEGRDRADLLAALEKVSGQDLGLDPAAWKRLAKGEDPASIPRRPQLAPTIFGIPIYGQRVVVVLDNSLRMSDPHPFDGDRLRELCEVEDGAPIPWFRMKTNGQFAHGHVEHLAAGLPRGSEFGLILFNARVQNVFEGFAPAGSTTARRTQETLEGLEPDDGIATYEALRLALDLAGARDKKAWRKGPDEIVFITVNMPTAGEIKEAPVVASAIGLEARLRGVPIHTVGIHFHPYEMCREIAERSGGRYVSLVE